MTKDRQDLLGQLHHCGVGIDWVNSTAGEAAADIWKQALRERNWDLFTLMCDFGVGYRKGDRPARAVVQSDDWDAEVLGKIAEHYPDSIVQKGRRYTMEDMYDPQLWEDPVVAAAVFEKGGIGDTDSLVYDRRRKAVGSPLNERTDE